MERVTSGMNLAFVLVCFTGASLAIPARPLNASITYNVTGTVDDIENNAGVVTPPIGIGSTLTGQFTFDVTTPRGGGGTNFSIFPGAATSVSFGLSGLPPIAITGTGTVWTINDVGSPLGMIDALEIFFSPADGATAPAIEGIPYFSGGLWFADTTETLFSVDPPPLANPDDALLSPWSFSFTWSDSLDTRFEASGTFTIAAQQVPPVPVPGAALLGTIGAGLVEWLRRRRAL